LRNGEIYNAGLVEYGKWGVTGNEINNNTKNMKFEIKFPELEQATEFANELKDKNLRGIKVS